MRRLPAQAIPNENSVAINYQSVVQIKSGNGQSKPGLADLWRAYGAETLDVSFGYRTGSPSKSRKNVAEWIALHPKKEDLTDRIEEHPWIALHPKKEERLAETNLAYRIEEHPKKQRPNANAKAKGKVKRER